MSVSIALAIIPTAKRAAPRVAVTAILALGGTFVAQAATAPFCAKDFRLDYVEFKLDATGGGQNFFRPEDQPRWPAPNVPVRCTGLTARSCAPAGSSFEVDRYEQPPGFTPADETMTVRYEDVCLPAFGGRYDVIPRFQMGHSYLGVNGTPIAEDFYVMDPVATRCVAYVADPFCDPQAPPPSCTTDCGCLPTNCEAPQGGADCPAGPGIYDHPPVTKTECVGMLSIRIRTNDTPNCALRNCCAGERYLNPIGARVYVDAWDGSTWVDQKAGTEFSPGSRTPWTNRDNCVEDPHWDRGPYPEQHDIPTDPLQFCNPDDPFPLTPDWTRPRIPIRFPIPAHRALRIHGTVTLFTCGGPGDFDIVHLLWPAIPPDGTGRYFKEITDQEVDRGELINVDELIENGNVNTSLQFLKICSLTCAPPPAPPRETTPGINCCGPEYSDLHGTVQLKDSTSCQREIVSDEWDMTLNAQLDIRLNGTRRRSNREWLNDYVFRCMPMLTFDPDPTDNVPFFNDATCDEAPCALWPSPGNCGPNEVAGEEWRTSRYWLPQANYRAPVLPWNGLWWRTSAFQLRLQDGKNKVWMAPIVGLHGMLMDEDPNDCATTIQTDPIYSPSWNNPLDYPNFTDIQPHLAEFLNGPCSGPGLLTINRNREVLGFGADDNPSQQELADDEKAFTICPIVDSQFPDKLGDKDGRPYFIRVADYTSAFEEAFPTWVPDRTWCSRTSSVRGIVRLIDGKVDLTTQEAHQIGLENPWTLRRSRKLPTLLDPAAVDAPNPPGDSYSDATQCADFPRFAVDSQVSRIVTRPYYDSIYSTSSEGTPRAETVLQYLWPHGPRASTLHQRFSVYDFRGYQCANEPVDGCWCGSAPDWPTFFGMPQLLDPRLPALRSQVEQLLGFPILRGEDFEDGTNDYHYENLVALTNDLMASASTRELTLEFLNEEFVSQIDDRPAPVMGSFILTDVTKPAQAHGRPIAGVEELPPSFVDPNNLEWPFIVPAYARTAGMVDAVVDARVGLDTEQPPDGQGPWCDVTTDTDPDLQPQEYGTRACDLVNSVPYEGRTLVDRFTVRPGDCKVENFGTCIGEMRFSFIRNGQPVEGEPLVIEGKGYFNSVRDSQELWAMPTSRPDLMVDLWGGPEKEIDLNEDGIPDQHIVYFRFERPVDARFNGKGIANEVVAFLPAGRYRIKGTSGFPGSEYEYPVLEEVKVPCADRVVTSSRLLVDPQECVQQSTTVLTGRVEGPDGCELALDNSNLPDVTWSNATNGAAGTCNVTLAQPRVGALIGTFDTGAIPLDFNCNQITVTARYAGQCGNAVQTVQLQVVRDAYPPYLAVFVDSVNNLIASDCAENYRGEPSCRPALPLDTLPMPFDSCTKEIVRRAYVSDICGPYYRCGELPACTGNNITRPARVQSTVATLTPLNPAGPPVAYPCNVTDQVCNATLCQDLCEWSLPVTCGLYRLEILALDMGNLSCTQTQEIQVVDVTPPVINGTDLTLECVDSNGVPASDQAIVSWIASITAADACGIVTLTNDAPTNFPSGCAPGVTTAVVFHAVDGCGREANRTFRVTVQDTTGPTLTVPAPLTLECTGPSGVSRDDAAILAWLALATTSDLCGGATIDNDAPQWFPTSCTGTPTTVTFRATDDCGNVTTGTSTVTVRDTTAPTVTAPAPITLECTGPQGVPVTHPDIVAWLAAATGADTCGNATVSNDAPPFFPTSCAGETTTVTFTATDACGLTAQATSTVYVEDTTAPVLQVPPPLVLECNGPGGVSAADPAIVAWLAQASATDACGTVTLSNTAPGFFPSSCQPGTTTTVSFTASDSCNVVTLTSTVTVRDTTAPTIVPPPPMVLECNGQGGVSRTDPAIVAWLGSVMASDVCGTATVTNDAPALFPAGCSPGTVTTVHFTATDGCNQATASSTVTVRDTTPPIIVVVPGQFFDECLWPPNHKWVCIGNFESRFSATDLCGQVTQVVADCISSQCLDNQGNSCLDSTDPPKIDDRGDGHTWPDCETTDTNGNGIPDKFCFRSERAGNRQSGRFYDATVKAVDACGNVSTPVAVAHVWVPHDDSTHPVCISPNHP